MHYKFVICFQRLEEMKIVLERKQSEQETNNKAAAEIIPTAQHILDNYDILNPEQKNEL